jgi:hypothetical protein
MVGNSEVVAGYFAKDEDANQAIRELIDEGFGLSEIGAAFHNASSQQARGSAPAGGPIEGDFPLQSKKDRVGNLTGVTSGTEAVRPWGLFTGGGKQFMGAERPGPITGSEVPPDLPRDVPSELGSKRESRASSHAYSGSAFENSFAGMGIPPEHAQRLSRELRRGGAVVTVQAGRKTPAAEQIMERNHGTIRYDSGPVAVEDTHDTGAQVDVFGEIHRVYPGYIPAEDARRRKAS